MAQLLHKAGDEDGALFNEATARRLAQNFLQDLKRIGPWAVYQEDAAFMKLMLQTEDPGVDVAVLTTPRQDIDIVARVISTIDGGWTERHMEAMPDVRPTRQWADDY
jgi:hypothetical protein